MIRHWEPTDIGVVAEKMLELRSLTAYGLSGDYDVSVEEMGKWLLQVYSDPRSTVILCDEEGVITGMAGVTYGELIYPPYLTTMYEWGLWAEGPRAMALVWKDAKEWGKKRGALYATRSILRNKGIHEMVKWEKLT